MGAEKPNKFKVVAANGNTTVAGTLGVTGVTTIAGQLNANGGIVCDTDKLDVNYGVSLSTAKAWEPNRRQVSYRIEGEGESKEYVFNTLDAKNQLRFFSDLSDKELSGNLSAKYKFNTDEDEDGEEIELSSL